MLQPRYKDWIFLLLIFVPLIASDDHLPPKIVHQNTENRIIYNPNSQDIILTCVAEGSGHIEYEWFKDGESLTFGGKIHPPHDNAGSFRIEKANRDHEGYYECHASNTWGADMSAGVTLQTSYLDYFSPATIQNIVIKEHEGLKVKTDFKQEFSNPNIKPEDVKWWTMDKETRGDKRAVVPDRRISVDVKGNLYFANVKQSDQDLEKKYALTVRNHVKGTTQEGSFTFLDIQSGSTATVKPEALTPTPQDEPVVVLVGEDAHLNCFFSGYPTPEISWIYNRLENSGARVQVNHFGSELFIKNIRESDEGPIGCKAANEGGIGEAQVQVKVESKPMFVDRMYPKDTTVISGSTVEVHCKVKAKPEATVTWYINGKPINSDDPGYRRTLKDDTLTITDVCNECKDESSDNMMIQCRARNEHGSVYSSGRLTIVDKTVILRDSNETVVLDPEDGTEKMVATFRCTVVTDEKSLDNIDIFWKHKNERLYPDTDPREIINITDNVATLTVDLRDAKIEDYYHYIVNYTCIAKTDHITAMETFTLKVKGVNPPLTVADIWWVFVILAIILLIILIPLCCYCCRRRQQRGKYPLDEKERLAGYVPEDELEDDGYHEYMRPSDEKPIFTGNRGGNLTASTRSLASSQRSLAGSNRNINNNAKPV